MNKTRNCNITFQYGDCAYRLHPYYGTMPEEYASIPVVGGCCDENDNLYLTTRNQQYPIIQLDENGNFVRTLGAGMFKMLHSVFRTPDNTFLCADTARHTIREIDGNGEFIRDIGTPDVPGDSGVDRGNLARKQQEGLLVDPMVEIDPNWAFIENIRTIKKAGAPFNRPTGAVIAPNGDIYASDGYANAAVHRFGADGALKKTWGGPGMEPGKFLVSHGIWADSRSRIWVADREGNSVQVFSEDGDLLFYRQEGMYQPSGIWGDGDTICVGERGGGITFFDMDFQVKGQIGFWLSNLRVHEMCGDSKGNLYLMPLPLYKYDSLYVLKLERI